MVDDFSDKGESSHISSLFFSWIKCSKKNIEIRSWFIDNVAEHLGQKLDKYIEKTFHGKVKLVRTAEREGLIRWVTSFS